MHYGWEKLAFIRDKKWKFVDQTDVILAVGRLGEWIFDLHYNTF